MSKKIIQERELSIQAYIETFPPGSPDRLLVEKKSGNMEKIIVRIVEEDGGRRFEDTTFTEKSGITYTVRTKIGQAP